jgi:lysophospholipase L1-like esterase
MLLLLRLLPLLLVLPLLGQGCQLAAPAEASPQPISYVALGASDAVGVGAAHPEREGWVPQLFERLPAGSRLANLGVSGSRLDQALEQQLPVALAARPDLVTVWLAVNDLNARVPLERYSANLDRLLGALSATGATVLVGNVPDVAMLPAYRSADAAQVRREVARWNAAIAASADRHGAIVVDLYSRWPELAQHPELVSADGFHPSAAGYARLADLFWSTLEADGGLIEGDGA